MLLLGAESNAVRAVPAFFERQGTVSSVPASNPLVESCRSCSNDPAQTASCITDRTAFWRLWESRLYSVVNPSGASTLSGCRKGGWLADAVSWHRESQIHAAPLSPSPFSACLRALPHLSESWVDHTKVPKVDQNGQPKSQTCIGGFIW
eukprot:3709219-Rhodomonas_salina.7